MCLSPEHEWLLWIISTILCSPSPLPTSPWKGGGRRAKKRQHCWIPFLQLLPAFGGQAAIGSALRVSQSCSLSNRKQKRQTAKLSSDVCVRLCERGERGKDGLGNVPCCGVRRVPATKVLRTSRDGSRRCSASHQLPPTDSSLSAQHIAFFNIVA